MQRSLGDLSAKVERLITDVGKQSDKVSDLRDKFNVFKGVWMVIAFFGIFIVPLATWFLNRTFPPPSATPPAAAPIAQTAPVAPGK